MIHTTTATSRYRWALADPGSPATEAELARRAANALNAITEDVQAMTVVIPFPAGLRFASMTEDETPTQLRVSGIALTQNPAAAIVAEEPVDPWPSAPLVPA